MGTLHLYNVAWTSMQRRDVASTFMRRCINAMCPLRQVDKTPENLRVTCTLCFTKFIPKLLKISFSSICLDQQKFLTESKKIENEKITTFFFIFTEFAFSEVTSSVFFLSSLLSDCQCLHRSRSIYIAIHYDKKVTWDDSQRLKCL